MLVEKRGFIPQIIGTDDGRIAGSITAAKIALLDDGDVADAMVLGQIVRRGEAVPACPDDDDVVGLFGVSAPPRRIPTFVVLEALREKRPGRIIFPHQNSPATSRDAAAKHPLSSCIR